MLVDEPTIGVIKLKIKNSTYKIPNMYLIAEGRVAQCDWSQETQDSELSEVHTAWTLKNKIF